MIGGRLSRGCVWAVMAEGRAATVCGGDGRKAEAVRKGIGGQRVIYVWIHYNRDVPGGGQEPECATTSKPKRKAGVDPAAAQGRRGAEQAEHLKWCRL